MRYKPKGIAALHIALGGLPDKMRVEVDRNIGVSANTVGELRKVTSLPENVHARRRGRRSFAPPGCTRIGSSWDRCGAALPLSVRGPDGYTPSARCLFYVSLSLACRYLPSAVRREN
jgi:hypothetical protein